MKKYTQEEIDIIKCYLTDFVDSFEPYELANAIKENIISLEEIEDAMRRKLKV